jgi:geranylgeranyl reductase family protein
MWDLAIVGAGPAGSAAALGALAANPGLRVTLLDRAEFPRDKSCGDGIAPHVFDVLRDVGVSGLVDDWRPVRRLQLQRADVTTARDMARPAWVVPRAVFDARLMQAAVRAGAHLERLRVKTVDVDANGVRLDRNVTARLTVGADGAHSVVRSALGVPPARRQALALRGYAPTPPDRMGQQIIVFSEVRQPSYAWSFDRGDGFANVGYGELLRNDRSPLTRASLMRRLESLLPGATVGGERWLGHHLPLSPWRWQQPSGRVLLAGDAAGLINPVTGEGIYYAVATGVLAGRSAAAALEAGDPASAGRRHRVAVRSLLGRHLRHTAAASKLVSVPAAVARCLRAADRDQGVFDDLVEVGLGRGLVTRRIVQTILSDPRTSTP